LITRRHITEPQWLKRERMKLGVLDLAHTQTQGRATMAEERERLKLGVLDFEHAHTKQMKLGVLTLSKRM